ncbi:PilZ domain-containing protein [Alkalicoccobacillus murimartini]|uniref:PilZ domain-containing protein n=1 Tax=Alkalicoccobacillus murimartini TaxID=171685 RepID=A0ABT9YCQ2_9BACI|nr:PilZ domain-containing protein [Alkalicoccobacillus murimartini]MDQ0205625.1 hypothetical protein [Alkalicoccobacillus murimartini]
MRYKRDESFRYDFQPVLDGTFCIVQVNHQEVKASNGKLSITNLSPKGIGIETQYDLPDPNNYAVTLQVECTLEEQPLTFEGAIQWKRPLSTGYSYGLELSLPEQSKTEMINLLKRQSSNQKLI